GKLGALPGGGDSDAAFPPRLTALLKGGVIEFAAAVQDKRHCLLLFRSRMEFVSKSLAYRLLAHATLFCLIALNFRCKWSIHPRFKAGAFRPIRGNAIHASVQPLLPIALPMRGRTPAGAPPDRVITAPHPQRAYRRVERYPERYARHPQAAGPYDANAQD